MTTASIQQITREINSMLYLALIVPLPDGQVRWSVTGNGETAKGIAESELEAGQAVDLWFETKGGAQ